MKIQSLTFALILLVFSGLSARAEIPVGWSTNYTAAASVAESARRPLLVFFTASWCGPCKLMGSITLADPVIQDAITNVEHVAVDIDENPKLAAQQGIRAVPTFVMFATTNIEVARVTGFQAIGDFLPWLTNGVSEANAALTRQVLVRKQLNEVDRLLASTQTNDLQQAAIKLFDLCDEPNHMVIQAAAADLRKIAGRDPSALLSGLDDPRLATRIQVANALRLKLGDTFTIDPWSNAATRRKEVQLWRDKFAKEQGQP